MSDVKCPKDMVYIPRGIFKMGSTSGGDDEQPVRDIYVTGFCMDKHEVTNAEYSSYKKSPSPSNFDGPNQPVVYVNWYEADAFCRSKGKSLPTEAEWEKAARGPEGREHGTKSGELTRGEAHYKADKTADVCSYPENGYGLCDMAGNVWEWVSVWYAENAYIRMVSGNLQGPSDGKEKVLRGGSWFTIFPNQLRAAYRHYNKPDLGDRDVGFRCVADPVKSEE